MMLKGKKQSVIGLGAIVLLAAGCSAEPTVETAAETTPEAVTENAVETAAANQDHNGVVEGIVRDASGEPVAGAFVKLKNEERRLTFMHISQDGG
ncbi:MAG: hypothetical protein V3S07_07910, partial [Micropepsaceae bacterium]